MNEQLSHHTNKETEKFGIAQADHRASGREGISSPMPHASKLSHSMDVGSSSLQTHPLLCLHLEDPDSIQSNHVRPIPWEMLALPESPAAGIAKDRASGEATGRGLSF